MSDIESEIARVTQQVEEKIGYWFQKRSLLSLALIHRSFVHENPAWKGGHNERLEFLGDAVLGLLVAEFLYKTFPEKSEGDLTLLKAHLVEGKSCLEYLQMLSLGDPLFMGKGEKENGKRGRGALLANLFESLLGAIYLDGGPLEVEKFFFSHFEQTLLKKVASPEKNWKALLQEKVHKGGKTLQYELIESSGPDHEKVFCMGVWIGSEKKGEGVGFSKRDAEQKAAKEALQHLRDK